MNNRESLLDITARSITGNDVVAALIDIIALRGKPVLIRCDNGPELVSEVLQSFCESEIGIRYIPPGEPGAFQGHSNGHRQDRRDRND